MRNLLLCLCIALAAPLAQAERLKDIASVAGVRSNQLTKGGQGDAELTRPDHPDTVHRPDLQ